MKRITAGAAVALAAFVTLLVVPAAPALAPDATTVEFPTKAPPVQQVSALTQRLASRISAAQAAERDAKHSADSARTIALVGVIVGALGLIAGGAALVVAGRRRGVGPRTPVASH